MPYNINGISISYDPYGRDVDSSNPVVDRKAEQCTLEIVRTIGAQYGSDFYYGIRELIFNQFKRIFVSEERALTELSWYKQRFPSVHYQTLNDNISKVLSDMNLTIEQFNQIDFNNPELQEILKEHCTLALLKK